MIENETTCPRCHGSGLLPGAEASMRRQCLLCKGFGSVPRLFIKHDQGKPRPTLLPMRALGNVVDVLEYGARKYAPGNWKKVDDLQRYRDAAWRHLIADASGEECDPESGLPHIDHALCCLMFISELRDGAGPEAVAE